jgi:hypothetical protein
MDDPAAAWMSETLTAGAVTFFDLMPISVNHCGRNKQTQGLTQKIRFD